MTNKEKTQISGTLTVDEVVIQDMAGYAALTCYGVAGIASPDFTDSIARRLSSQKARRGVLVKEEEEGISIEIFIVVQYGMNLSVVAENLADTIRYYITELLDIKVVDVSITIQGIKR